MYSETVTLMAASPIVGPPNGIPLPIVTLNRCMLILGVALGLVIQQPLIITILFLTLLSSVTFGPKGGLPYQIGTRLLTKQVQQAKRDGQVEDRRLMRFNNSVALILFAAALICFTLGQPVAGWILAAMVLIAAAVALAGFCVGCFIFYRFRLAQFRWNRAT